MATFASIKQLSELEPAFSVSSIRHMLFNGDKNGLNQSGAVSRIGTKVVIHVEKFTAWIEGRAK